ncbi:MATE family efflux transporter [Paenibacillus albiflavus]|uniref:Probable multidrug resistance protein NorM n=1 Tax=Paenibacillus albiflavus TaxID=2545760 RepID=A0A4V2WPN1_9BACL|nr:MATE family efflux transporter [Paenibacillus albiflavus]TCZ80042.1 MATE family efflux transporter [Paenibacillus albiflavus]
MKQTFTTSQKIRQMLVILLPILITQIALFSMSFFDTTMSGHASPVDLAGVAIGVSIWTPINTGVTGILLAVTPIIAQLLGSKRKEQIPEKIVQAIYLGVIIAISIIIIGIFTLGPILNLMSLDPDVHDIAHRFLVAISIGIVPLFIYTVLRCFIDAHGYTRITMFITLMTLPINIILNYLLIFGKFGFPKLGGVGSGYASAVTYWIILLITVFFIWRKQPFAELRIFSRLYRISLRAWKEILKIGVPIGFAIFFETAVFATVTLLMSQFNTTTIAAHQAANNFASFLYMVPMSISMGLTILVGYEVGAKRLKDAKIYSYLGICLAIFLSLLCAIGLLVFTKEIAGFYTTDAAVLALAQQFLIYALFFQLSDAIAAPIQGALRGYKDVNSSLIMAFVSYWIISLPLGYYLANYTDLQAFGYWIGLNSGLAAGAIFLLIRLITLQRKHERMNADRASS